MMPESSVQTDARPQRKKGPKVPARLYLRVVTVIVLLILLVALVAANLQAVEVDWLVGSAEISLVWVILVAAIIGWLLGVVTSALARHPRRR